MGYQQQEVGIASYSIYIIVLNYNLSTKLVFSFL